MILLNGSYIEIDNCTELEKVLLDKYTLINQQDFIMYSNVWLDEQPGGRNSKVAIFKDNFKAEIAIKCIIFKMIVG